jgi:hypothetical protein
VPIKRILTDAEKSFIEKAEQLKTIEVNKN